MRKFVTLFASRASASLFQAILFFLVARDSGPSVFGVISVVMAAAIFVSVIAEFGMATYLSRVSALDDYPTMRAILRINAIATVVLMLILAGAAAAVAVTHTYSNALALGAVALASASDRYLEVTLAIPVAAGRMAPVTISLALRRVTALLVYLILPIPEPTLRFGLALLLGQLMAAFHSELVVVRQARRHYERTALPAVVRSSFPYFVATMSFQFRWLDSALVSFAAGSYAAGIYSAADKLVRPVLLVSQTMQTLILPRSTRMTTNGARRDAHRIYVGAAVAFVLLIPAMIWARQLVELTLGAEFSDAVTPLRVLLASLPLTAAAAPLGSLLQGQGDEKFVSRNSALFAGVVVICVILGAFAAGAGGASVGLALASAVCTLTLVIRIENLDDNQAHQ